jgi:hypothetical protein
MNPVDKVRNSSKHVVYYMSTVLICLIMYWYQCIALGLWC